MLPVASRADGSIAHNSDSGSSGISYNFRSRRAADESALDHCGGGDCEVVERFRHSCGAVARARGGGYGYAVRDGLRAAEHAAMDNCLAQNNRCEVAVSGCDD